MTRGLVQRQNIWYLKRRVPLRFSSVEPRAEIWRSLKTDSRQVAVMKAEQIWLEMTEAWEAALAGRSEDAAERFRAAKVLSDIRGFKFLSAEQVADQPVEDILRRVEASRDVVGGLNANSAAAFLGVVDQPTLMLSDLASHVEELAALDNKFKNARQMRVWRNARKRAASNLRSALGKDIAVMELSSVHAKAHKKWWEAKIQKDGTSIETANKDFNYMSGMLTRFYDNLDVEDAPRPYANVGLKDRFKAPKRKGEVPVDYIVNRWFAPSAFDGLNSDARDILLLAVETGCRQSELFDLPPSAFNLDGDLPYIAIEHEEAADDQDGREIKNMHSVRHVPLVGVALAAARRNPHGFPRYRGKAGFSAVVNKYLRNHGLVPKGVTAGGLRHTWESRMKRAGYQIDDRGELMGHSVKGRRGREHYGDELTLADRFEMVRKIALPVPDHLS